MLVPELTLVEEVPLESNWSFSHTGPYVPWVTTVCHCVTIGYLFPLPVEGMEEGCKGSFIASLTAISAACSNQKNPMRQQPKLDDTRIYSLQHLPLARNK